MIDHLTIYSVLNKVDVKLAPGLWKNSLSTIAIDKLARKSYDFSLLEFGMPVFKLVRWSRKMNTEKAGAVFMKVRDFDWYKGTQSLSTFLTQYGDGK